MTVRDSITRTGARTPGAEDYPTSMAAHVRATLPTQCGTTVVASTCAQDRHKPNISRCMPGAGLSQSMRGKVLSYMPAFQPYRGKPAVRNDREGRGNVGIIRSPVRASTLPDCGGRSAMSVPTATRQPQSWCDPAGEGPAQVKVASRLVASVARPLATVVAKRSGTECVCCGQSEWFWSRLVQRLQPLLRTRGSRLRPRARVLQQVPEADRACLRRGACRDAYSCRQ